MLLRIPSRFPPRRLLFLLLPLLCPPQGLSPLATFPAAAATSTAATSRRPGAAVRGGPIHLTDVTAESGVDFRHHNGAAGRRWLPETMGSGVVVLDADGDGHLDLLLLDGRSWGRRQPGEGPHLYRGRGDLTFEDVTTRAGLPAGLYAMGGAAADLDGDGAIDLVLTALDGVRVLWGRGDGGFEGAADPPLAGGWCTGVALSDFDGDGWMDLFVGRYVQWSRKTDIWCTLDGRHKSYCTPDLYEGLPCVLLAGGPHRRFTDVTAESGVGRVAKALGVVAADFDDDGHTDVFVANDAVPDFLFLYRPAPGFGRFEESGLASGLALDEAGLPRAGMGVDVADVRGGGSRVLAVGNFAGQQLGLYRDLGGGRYADEATAMGLGAATLPELTFGAVLVDLDLDGWPDLVTANGHIEPDIQRTQPHIGYRQPLGVYRNVEGRRFVRLPDAAPATPLVARGLAYGDFDGDGDIDLVVTQNGGPALLLRNDLAAGRSLRVKLRSTTSPSPPAGALVEIETTRGRRRQVLRLGSSYLSCSEAVLTFGVTAADVVGWTVRWPSGRTSRWQLADLPLDTPPPPAGLEVRVLRLVEPKTTPETTRETPRGEGP